MHDWLGEEEDEDEGCDLVEEKSPPAMALTSEFPNKEKPGGWMGAKKVGNFA